MPSISILISTSPRPGHPDSDILDQTVASIRATLPDSPIIIMADGVPNDITPQRALNYSGFKSRIQGRYDNSKVLEFDTHCQQSGMLGRGLELVNTPLLVYAEDDWSLSPNIEWDALGRIILSGRYNLIRFYAYCRIHPLHEGMMHEREIVDGIPFVRTLQYSQNPHLASTDFYRAIHTSHLHDRTSAIEEIMHGRSE